MEGPVVIPPTSILLQPIGWQPFGFVGIYSISSFGDWSWRVKLIRVIPFPLAPALVQEQMHHG